MNRAILWLAALSISSGSLMAAQGYIMPWCNWQTGEIEVYQIPPLNNPLTITVEGGGEIGIPFIGKIKYSLPPWKPLPETLGPDMGSAKKIGTIAGKDCKYQQGKFQLGHPYEMSDPIAKYIQSITHVRLPAEREQASSDTTKRKLLGLHPYVVPVPLSLPSRFDIPVGANPGGCDGNVSVYQIENDLDTVVHMTPCPQTVVSEIKVCSSPLELAVTPDASTVIVTCYNNAIVWIDTATDKVSFTLSTPNAFPAGVAISPDGTRAYVTNYYDANPNPSLLVIDVVKRTILSTIPLQYPFPGVVALTPDGSQAWINYYQASLIDVVDLASGQPASRIDLQENAQNGIAFNPSGTRAFIAAGTNHLVVVDTATLQILAKVTVADTPLDVVVSLDGSRVLVGSYSSGTISLVDAAQYRLIQNFTINGPGQGLAVIPIP